MLAANAPLPFASSISSPPANARSASSTQCDAGSRPRHALSNAAIAFVIGSLMLFDPAGENYQVSVQVALLVAATMAALVGLAALKIVQVRRAPVVTAVMLLLKPGP